MKRLTVFFCCVFIFLLCGQAERKEVYLTFDDGPSKLTENILETLKSENVKATFFLIGKNAERYPQTVEKIYTEGHSLGIHSYTHEYKKIYASVETLANDIKRCENVFKKLLPQAEVKIFRFAGGSFNLSEDKKSKVNEMGYAYYDWNASACDCEIKNATKDEILDCVKKTSGNKKRIILLMHDCANKQATANALKEIIVFYRQKGYVFKKL